MTDRLTADTINDDALDALYARVATAEEEADASVAAAARLTTLVGKRSEKAERAAKGQRFRADIAETELRTLRCGLRANGADPTQLQNLWAQISLRNRQWREAKREVRLTRSMLEEEGGDVSLVDEMISTVAKAEREAREAQAAVERVRALHKRNENTGECEYCSFRDYPTYAVPFPCDTVRTLDGQEQ